MPKTYTKVVGFIDPERWYTKEGLLRAAGIGGKQLREARQAGFLPAKYRGGRLYWKGFNVIRYIEAGEDR